MKKWIVMAAAALLVAGTAAAQIPEEKQASADRIALLKQDAPKDCGIREIDEAVGKCKMVADGTVAIADATGALTGDSVVDPTELAERIAGVATELSGTAQTMADAVAALKQVKNPMKLKSAKKSLDYAQGVVKAAGEELPYQGKVVTALVAGK